MAGSNYIVMTYARCGATWLAQLLGSTGCLGRPEDWFNGKGYRGRGIADYPLDRPGQHAKALSEGRSPNGVAGVKMSVGRVDQLAGFDWTGPLAPLRWIHLTRSDPLARAISEVRAEQTGQWRSTTASQGEPRYDAEAIRVALLRQERNEARVRLYCTVNRIVPLGVTYEELHADPETTVLRIAAFLGVALTGPPDHGQVTLAMQRDELNTEWRDRYLAEAADLNRIPSLARPRRLGIFRR